MLGHVPVILNHSSYVMYGRPLSARAILASRRADQVRSCILSWLVRASHVLLAEPPQERRGWPRRARPRRRREGTRSHRKRGPERSRTTARPTSLRAGRARLRVHPGNRQELLSLEARAADQRAVHIVDRQQLLGVRRLHRTAVEDADPLR